MFVSHGRLAARRPLLAVALVLALVGPVSAQGMGVSGLGPVSPQMAQYVAQTQAPQTPEPTGFATTNVSFLDSAIPFSHFRLRFDSNYGDVRPTRAEYLYPKGGLPFSPGPPRPETRIDGQQLGAYVETALGTSFSIFFQTPLKWVNPQVNPNEVGLGDMDLGLKYAFISNASLTTTFQLRVTMPSRSGPDLSVYHWSAEPALLLNYRLMDYLTLEGDVRYWASIGGKDFAGDVARYGLGLSWGEHLAQGPWINPVAEVVGWTVVSGKELVVWSPTAFAVKNSGGETIVNGSLGLRMGLGNRLDLYAGYSRALTGDVWYKQTYRVEFRLLF